MTPRTIRPAASLAALCLFASTSLAQAAARPEFHVVTDVALDPSGASEARFQLVLRDGQIVDVRPVDSELPPGARIIEGLGRLALPAFIDGLTRAGVEAPEPVKDQDLPVPENADVRVDMRLANRKGVQPAFRANEALALDEAAGKAMREAGFGAALVAPGGQLLAGTSVLATAREAAMRDVVLVPDVFAHAEFAASGPGYPSTLMGYIAQLRQFFLDVRHQAELHERYEAGLPGPRPPFDADLAAGLGILDGSVRLLCHAETSRDVERWLKLADQFGFQPAFSGGRDAWRVAETLKEREIPVILTLDWGEEADDPDAKKKDKKKDKGKAKDKPGKKQADEPDDESEGEPDDESASEDDAVEGDESADDAPEEDWTYLEPLELRREKRRLWEETRDGALRLHEAGVTFAFGTAADGPKDLLKRVRDLVEAGLPQDVALAGLTENAAAILGVRRLGKLEPGFDATFTLWTANPLTDKKAQAACIVIDGYPVEFEIKDKDKGTGEGPAEGVDVTGTWNFVSTGEDGRANASTTQLEMDEDGTVTGSVEGTNPMDGSALAYDVEGRVEGTRLFLEASITMDTITVELELDLEIDGDTLRGDAKAKVPFSEEPMNSKVEATREPGRSATEDDEDEHDHPHHAIFRR